MKTVLKSFAGTLSEAPLYGLSNPWQNYQSARCDDAAFINRNILYKPSLKELMMIDIL